MSLADSDPRGESFAIALQQNDHRFGVLIAVSLASGAAQIAEASLQRLLPEERAVAETLRGFRQTQWVGARIAWRAVAATLGCAEWPLLTSATGAPDGPPHLSVSVAHKRSLAVVLAGPRSAGLLGVDIEDDEAAAESIAPLVFDDQERAAFDAMIPAERARAQVLAFSLKESIYKAHGPNEQRALKYTDASVAFDAMRGAPTVTMRPPYSSQMDIWAERRGPQVLTAIRRSPSTT